ncbi:MAG: hypothetical protein JXQ72_14175 [Anaerolineae bacterium]|nr:hypothetical protein [Anaerolineae bacterium]
MAQRGVGVIGFVLVALLMSLAGSSCGLIRGNPPTVTPIYITATPEPVVLPIVATETPSLTAVVAAVTLPTQPAQRSPTPTRIPQITMTPTFTPTTTDTPVTPGSVAVYGPVGGGSDGAVIGGNGVVGAGNCASVPDGAFGAIYQSDPNIPAAIGCPLAAAAINISSAYQSYQNGVMIWVSSLGAQPQSAIYALFNNGTYQRYNDTWIDGTDPVGGGAVPPDGLLEPVRGFGKVWRDHSTVRDGLGWATSGESGGGGQILLFERGEMVSVSQAGQTYILITGAPGTWTARSGG